MINQNEGMEREGHTGRELKTKANLLDRVLNTIG
jgi:hypothetical protein